MRSASAARSRRALPFLLVPVVLLMARVAGASPAPGLTVLSDAPSGITLQYEPLESTAADRDGEGWSRVALVQVPDRGSVSFRCVPEGRAAVSEPGIMRDVRVVQVAFDVPAGDPRPVAVDLTFGPSPGPNERTSPPRPASPAFESVYRNSIVNYRPLTRTFGSTSSRDQIPFGGRCLIIAVPSLASTVQPLADWKHRKGVQTKLVTLNDTGSSASQIRSYIQTAYNSWTVPPEYVLLVGDTEELPTYYSETATDDYYATLEGSDYFVDVMVGRLTADTPGQCATLVAKALAYERTPIEDDAHWPASGLMTVADDFDDGDAIYYMNTWFIYDLMAESGFAPIDTLFRRNNSTQTHVYNSWNQGPGYVNFRGQGWTTWPSPFDINPSLLTNTRKNPVVVSGTCGTGAYEYDGFICEAVVRAGSASNPVGGVAFFATNTVIESDPILSRRRGAGDMGFFEQAFGPDGGPMGAACVAAKMAIYGFDQVRQEYEGWNLLGDPDMLLWTAPPAHMQVVHGQYFHASQDSFVVTALEGGVGLPGAQVGCVKGSDLYAWGITDASGRAVFHLSPSSSGTMSVTVTARNHYPYEGEVSVLDSGPFLVWNDFSIDDTAGGNGDGLLGPGETADVTVRLMNIGDVDAVGVTGTLTTRDALVAVPDSVASYGTILHGGSAWSLTPYSVSAADTCAVGHLVALDLEAAFGANQQNVTAPLLPLATPDLDVVEVVLEDDPPGGDGQGTASPGEAVGLIVTLENVGLVAASDVSVELVCLSPHAFVTAGGASLGPVGAGETASNSVTPFVLSISPGAPDGHLISLRLDVVG